MRIALKALANSQFVCAEGKGQQPLIANRDKVQSWETFEVFLVNLDGSIMPIPETILGPAPEPTPLPKPGTTEPISGAQASPAYVAAVKSRLEEMHTNTSGPEGAFNVVKWVVWGLKLAGSDIGLQVKTGGENVVVWKGVKYAAGRVCYPDGRIYKILTDVGGANGPTWDANGVVSPEFYAVPMDPAL